MKHLVHLNSMTSMRMMPTKAKMKVPIPNQASSDCAIVLEKSNANQMMVSTRIRIIKTSAPIAIPLQYSREQHISPLVATGVAAGKGARGQPPSGHSPGMFFTFYLFFPFFSCPLKILTVLTN